MPERYQVGDITITGEAIRVYVGNGYLVKLSGHKWHFVEKGDTSKNSLEIVALTLDDIAALLREKYGD